MNRQDVRDLGRQWYTHPEFAETGLDAPIQRIQREVDAFLETLGYKHNLLTNSYDQLWENNERVAFFAHEGVGAAILSCMLDIPYPIFSTHFDMSHSDVTVIHFEEKFGTVVPMVLSYSNDSHLYREGLPTRHQNRIFY